MAENASKRHQEREAEIRRRAAFDAEQERMVTWLFVAAVAYLVFCLVVLVATG